jgi:DNA ligase (NAD+)
VRNLFDAIEARREIALERFIYALGMRHVGETTALALARGYGAWQAFHDAGLKIAKGDAEAARRDGRDRPDRRGRGRGGGGLFRESHNRKMVERLDDQVTIVDAEKPKSGLAGRRQDRGVHRLAREDDARRGQGNRRAARRQGSGSVSKKTDYVVAGPAPARS